MCYRLYWNNSIILYTSLTLSDLLRSAPLSTRSFTISIWPPLAAAVRGVPPCVHNVKYCSTCKCKCIHIHMHILYICTIMSMHCEHQLCCRLYVTYYIHVYIQCTCTITMHWLYISHHVWFVHLYRTYSQLLNWPSKRNIYIHTCTCMYKIYSLIAVHNFGIFLQSDFLPAIKVNENG